MTTRRKYYRLILLVLADCFLQRPQTPSALCSWYALVAQVRPVRPLLSCCAPGPPALRQGKTDTHGLRRDLQANGRASCGSAYEAYYYVAVVSGEK